MKTKTSWYSILSRIEELTLWFSLGFAPFSCWGLRQFIIPFFGLVWFGWRSSVRKENYLMQ